MSSESGDGHRTRVDKGRPNDAPASDVALARAERRGVIPVGTYDIRVYGGLKSYLEVPEISQEVTFLDYQIEQSGRSIRRLSNSIDVLQALLLQSRSSLGLPTLIKVHL